MNVKYKIFLTPLVAGLIILFISVIYAENGLLEFRLLEKERDKLITENSKIALKLIDEIAIFKRLANNDLQLIDRLAREQGMIGKNELLLIPRESVETSETGEPNRLDQDNFRILTDDEIDELLKFDILEFKFYEKLKENDEDIDPDKEQPNRNVKDSDRKTPSVQNGKTSKTHKNITIQVAAFKNRKSADRLVATLKGKGYQACWISSKSSEGTIWHKVRIGKFKSTTKAQDLLNRLKKEKFKPIIVKR